MENESLISCHGGGAKLIIQNATILVVEEGSRVRPLCAIIDERTWWQKLFGVKPIVVHFEKEDKKMVSTGLMCK